jgi:hypothetical protein
LKTIGRSRNHAASALSRSVLEFRPPQNKCLRSGRQTELLEVQPRVECGTTPRTRRSRSTGGLQVGIRCGSPYRYNAHLGRGSTGRLAQSSPSPTIAAASCPALRHARQNAEEFLAVGHVRDMDSAITNLTEAETNLPGALRGNPLDPPVHAFLRSTVRVRNSQRRYRNCTGCS